MLQTIHWVSFVLLLSGYSSSMAFPMARAGVQIAYHVGDIVEHAYTNEAPAQQPNPHPFYPHLTLQQLPPPPPPHSTVHNADHRQQAVSTTSTTAATTTTITTTTTTTTAAAAAATPSTTTTSTTKSETKDSSSTKTAESQGQNKNEDSAEDDEDSSQTEQSLAAFLAMLEETKNVVPSTTTEKNQKKEEPKVTSESQFTPQAGAMEILSLPGFPPPQQQQQQQQRRRQQQPAPPSPPRNPYEGWAVYDDLDTQESNQTAVIASDQKFGYVVNGNNYKRFRVEEKASNGLITGLFGFHHNNGNIRGVQYTADPSISPKFLYDTLVKFVSS